MRNEENLHFAVCKWLSFQYPNVIYISEASGARVSMGVALKLKKMRSSGTHLDLYILEPRGKYHGLILELKAADIFYKGTNDLKKSQHVEDQALMMQKLNIKGYRAEFAVGFDQAVKIIKDYMDGGIHG